MSRHVDAIKELLFVEPEFDNDEGVKSKTARRKERKKSKRQLEDTEEVKNSSVETIVFRDPAKRRKLANVSIHYCF
jgi:hypothetical protein